jgi:hypothetical protein
VGGVDDEIQEDLVEKTLGNARKRRQVYVKPTLHLATYFHSFLEMLMVVVISSCSR